MTNLPHHLLINLEALAAGSGADLLEFFQAVARLFLRRMAPGPELDEQDFVETFAMVALQRLRGDPDYLPVVTAPTPSALLQRSLWANGDADVSLADLWKNAKAEAALRDPYHLGALGGTLLSQSSLVGTATQITRAARRFSKQFYWDVDATLQDWLDPATSTSHLAGRLQGKWEPLSAEGATRRGDRWNFFPVAALEGRVGSTFSRSDLLILGGWKTQITGQPPREMPYSLSRRVESSVYLQTGYSAQRVIGAGRLSPGVEVAAAVGQPLDHGGHWQVLATLGAGLQTDSLREYVAGMALETNY